MPKAKTPSLTLKEKKLVKGIVEGKTKRQAAMDAYGASSIEVAGTIASNTLRKVNVQEALQAAFEEYGLTVSKVIKPIADGLVAEKVSIVGNGDQAMAEITPDHPIRLKAAGMALGLMIPKDQTPQVNINFNNIVEEQKNKYGF